MTDKTYPFIDYLTDLAQREDRGALAALRRGLGHPPGTTFEMYPYVSPWLPNDAPRWREDAYFLTASLFALHPAAGGSGNMGSHFAGTRDKDSDNTAVERRFANLLAAHQEDLPVHMRQAVSYLRSKEMPINWHRLFTDIQQWGHPSGYVQKEWARAFWGKPNQAEGPENTTE